MGVSGYELWGTPGYRWGFLKLMIFQLVLIAIPPVVWLMGNDRIGQSLAIGLFLVWGAIFILASILFHHRYARKYYSGLNRLDRALDSLNREEEPLILDDRQEEGIEGRLVTLYNQTAKRLYFNRDKLEGDRTFLREIMTDISHQLKTPLASLVMYNDLMLNEEEMDPDKRREFLEAGNSQLKRMEWLIKGLLKIARLETQTIEFEKKDLDIPGIIDRAVQGISPVMGERTFILTDERMEKLVLRGDGPWLAEAVQNILKNMVQFTGPGGHISVVLSDTPLFLRLTLEDDGPGIPGQDLPHIFERFHRGGNSVNMESVGIGLNLTKMIVTAHGGDVRGENKESRGARFIITLPY